MPARPVNSEILRGAIHEEAKQNAGFLYVVNTGTVPSISEKYKENIKSEGFRETLGNSKWAKKVTEEDIRGELDDLTERDYITELREGVVYFIDPFNLPGSESSSLKRILERIFRSRRYHTQTTFVDHLQTANISIAEDDLQLFINELKDRNLLKEIGSGTVYYRPGQSLVENSNLGEISEILEDDAGTDGCLTVSGIGLALDIDHVEDEVIRDLTDHKRALFDLNQEYLVNTDNCIDSYVTSRVERGLAREVSESFRSHDWVMPEDELESVIRQKTATLLRKVNREGILYDLRDGVIKSLDLSKTEIDHESGRTTLYLMEENLMELIEEEAERIMNEVASQVGDTELISMPTVMEQYASLRSYGSDSRVNNYISSQVEEAARETIDSNQQIPVWQTIEN